MQQSWNNCCLEVRSFRFCWDRLFAHECFGHEYSVQCYWTNVYEGCIRACRNNNRTLWPWDLCVDWGQTAITLKCCRCLEAFMNKTVGVIVVQLYRLKHQSAESQYQSVKWSQHRWNLSPAAASTSMESIWNMCVQAYMWLCARVCVYSVHNALMVFDQEQIACRPQHINLK